MSRLLKATAAAALLSCTATLAMAQGEQNPTGDARPLPPSSSADGGNAPYDQRSEPTNPTRSAPGNLQSGSRAIGPPAEPVPADPTKRQFDQMEREKD
jgi:hypothetical protein